MSDTFASLGIPFPLFEAPTDDAGEYVGVATCSLCRRAGQHCFRLDIGCAVVLNCPKCGAENGLDANDRKDGPCRRCGQSLKFPDVRGEMRTCYGCLRAGRAAITKDTELGMVSWEQARDGVTHGVPGLDRDDFEMVPRDDDWVAARVPGELLYELLRTPTYTSIQGERWQFCCRVPMVYIGRWDQDGFNRHSSDGDGRRLFETVVADAEPGLWDALEALRGGMGVYVFRCRNCGRVAAHWDLD
jgi:uncharacterized protein CbrC (UPF0167 family)